MMEQSKGQGVKPCFPKTRESEVINNSYLQTDSLSVCRKGASMPKKKPKDYGTNIPRHEIEALAVCLLPDCIAFFESEEGKREYEEWKRQQAEIKKAAS